MLLLRVNQSFDTGLQKHAKAKEHKTRDWKLRRKTPARQDEATGRLPGPQVTHCTVMGPLLTQPQHQTYSRSNLRLFRSLPINKDC